MTRTREYGSRGSARGRRPREPQTAEATVETVVDIVRRVGVALHKALDAAVSELMHNDMIASAETLRDELKPLCDALIHFESKPEAEDAEV